MNINHINDLMFSVSYLKHNIKNLSELQKEQNEKMLLDPEYKDTTVYKIKEERMSQCIEIHDIYVKFFKLGDMYKLENLLSEINNGK